MASARPKRQKKSNKSSIPEKLCWREVLKIEKEYIPGTLGWLEKNHPKANRKLNQYFEGLNETWEKYLEGKTTLDDFNKALQRWVKYLLKIIRAYRKAQNKKEGGGRS